MAAPHRKAQVGVCKFEFLPKLLLFNLVIALFHKASKWLWKRGFSCLL
jgi:hypothetical protein